MLHVLDTVVYPIGFEALEIKPTTRVGGIGLAREIDQLNKGATDLERCRGSG